MSRLCAISLPSLRVEIARPLVSDGTSAASPRRGQHLREQPLAVVIAHEGGVVQEETSLLGNTRLDEVSLEAFALGVRPGQTIAAARAKLADLAVRVVHVDAVKGALASIAEASLAFGARTFFEAGGVAGDVVWCDVTGCARLFGGEKNLAQGLADRICAMGHVCRVAVSDGPRIAAAVARFAPTDRPGPLIIPAGKGELAMQRLPLVALPFEPETAEWLEKLGLRTAGDLARLPRASLGTRLGQEGPRVMQLLQGDDRERLPPYVPPEIPEERAELEYGIGATEALVFVVKHLADRLAARLAGRCRKAHRLQLVLLLDRAILPAEKREHRERTLEVSSPAPIARADELLSLLRARLESFGGGPGGLGVSRRESPNGPDFEAPILAVTLRAKELVVADGQPLDLLVPEARAEKALPRLAAELAAELGEERVGTFALCDSWIPEERARLVSLSAPRASTGKPKRWEAPLLSGAPEPSRLLPGSLGSRPQGHGSLGGHPQTPGENEHRFGLRVLLERLEAVQWWKRGFTSRTFLAAWAEGTRAMAWVEVTPEEPPRLRGWLD
jgi:protein ImuB